MIERTTGRAALIWSALACALLIPVMVAATSPLLEWREPVYIAAGLAGVLGLCLLLVQPLLAARTLPGLSGPRAMRLHRYVGLALVFAVVIHVLGLWLTSPPDVIDALLLRSATPFSIWGVLAMWALFGAAGIALFRRQLGRRAWRLGHTVLAVVIVASTVAHAVLIEGTMGLFSKGVLCVLAIAATLRAVYVRKAWQARSKGVATEP